MTTHTIYAALCWLQMAVGLGIVLGGLLLSLTALDASSSRMLRWSVSGLVAWGAWFGMVGFAGGHDSPAALALAGLVAVVLHARRKHLADILAGALWWPPNAENMAITVFERARRPSPPWWVRWNPLGNVDDTIFGDAKWRAGRPRTPLLAVQWWFRNPFHNIAWYGLGVADLDRSVEGRFGNAFHRPGGGWLICWTHVVVGGVALSLPFVSYISPHVKFYLGWRPSGAFGPKFNVSAKGAIEVPQ